MRRRGLCFVIAAPSGAGKSTIIRSVLEREEALFLSVSVTTRAPRPGEIEGVHYYYRTREAFDRMAASGELLEHATVFGRSYGTPRAPMEAALASGRDVALDVDWQGYRQVKAALPEDTVGVFILPPSLEVLDARLRGRGSDDPAEIGRRMQMARSEISHWSEFDHVVVNDRLDACVETVRSVLTAARCTAARSLGAAALAEAMMAGRIEGDLRL
jgi:guanylate kinase